MNSGLRLLLPIGLIGMVCAQSLGWVPPGSWTMLDGSASLPSLRNDLTGWVGFRFTVGPQGLTAGGLCRFSVTGNSASHAVKLVRAADESDVPGASLIFNAGSTVCQPFRPAEVALAANTSYYLISQEVTGGDWWYDLHPVTGSSAASVDGAVSFTSDRGWLFTNLRNSSFGGVGVIFDMQLVAMQASCGIDPAVVTPGSSVKITVTVENVRYPALASTTGVFLGTAPDPGTFPPSPRDPRALKFIPTPALPTGGSVTLTDTVKIPNSVTPGSYYINCYPDIYYEAGNYDDPWSYSQAALQVVSSLPSNAAQFVNLDTSTKGNWKGVYGNDGSLIANDSTNLPSYGTASVTGANIYTWVNSTTDVRALLKGSSTTDRIASAWYSGAFTIDVSFTDLQQHQVALYLLDWDSTRRAQTVQVLDATTLAVLDTRTLSDFGGGVYAVWNVSGHVRFQLTRTAGSNAVVSGILFGGGASLPPPPTVSITTPAQNQSVSGTVAVTATATSSAGIASVQFMLDGANLGSAVTTSPYTVDWNTMAAANGSHTLTAIATDTSNQKNTSAGITVAVSNSAPATPAAQFLSYDTSTQGNWKNVYGNDGYVIAGDATSLPGYAVVGLSPSNLYTWASSTVDLRALQKSASTSDRIAATWYGAFTIDINFTDNNSHQVGLYGLDWDNAARSENFQVVNAATQAVLDSRSLANFGGGTYVVWNITGHVQIQVTRSAGPNAVISGLFLH